jgi:SprT-like protein
MDNDKLQRLVEEISVKYFNKPFRHQALFNPRLKTTGGRYLLRSHNIEMNKKYLEQLGTNELIGIIKHELCHYHLHLGQCGYKHGDQDFKALLKKVGAPRYCTPLPESLDKRKNQKVLTYICTKCNQMYKRKRRIDTKKYVCGRCNGKLNMIEDKTLE